MFFKRFYSHLGPLLFTASLFLLVVFLSFFTCLKAGEHPQKMHSSETGNTFERPSSFSGQFYPSGAEKLKGMIQKFLEQASPWKGPGRLSALICPHAGYIYSGQIAAYSYKLLEKRDIDTVILIGPSHRYPLKGVSVWPKGIYKTPLGQVRINEKIATRIIQSSDSVKFERDAHLYEHSLEVQIPFLQCVLKDFQIVPLLVNRLTPKAATEISRELASLLNNPRILLIASTDLSHYHSYDKAKAMDKKALSAIQAGDIEGLKDMLKKGEAELCGEMPVLLLMETINHMDHSPNIKLLKYANSGDITGMKKEVVGYCAVCISLTDETPVLPDNTGINKNNHPLNTLSKGGLVKPSDKESVLMKRGEKKLAHAQGFLNEQEKKKLLHIARTSITSYLKKQDTPKIEVTETRLLEPRGGFVTLHKKGMLRGCIGYVKALMPLYKVVSECAVSAAVRDYRFPPLKEHEIDEIDIEISALSPMQKVDDIQQIKVGEHGLYISQPPNTGLLLPQVATEYGWDRLKFLAQTCRKAGLAEDAWQKGAQIYIFSAQVFGEKER